MKKSKDCVEFTGIEGHIILLCKGWYDVPKVNRVMALKRLWAVRCGLDNEFISDRFLPSIASELVRLILKVSEENPQYFLEKMHDYITTEMYFEGNESITERIVRYYMYRLNFLSCVNDNKERTVKFPKPKKRVVKRIAKGNTVSGDYELLKN